MTSLRDRAEDVLRRLAGDSAVLRPDQWTAISALVSDHRRVLCVQRTGWGKSAVYFVATALLRRAGSGPTVSFDSTRTAEFFSILSGSIRSGSNSFAVAPSRSVRVLRASSRML